MPLGLSKGKFDIDLHCHVPRRSLQCFDKLSTNGREGHGQFGSARMVRETHVSYPLPFALSSRRVSGSGGRIVVVEHAGLRSCFDKLSTNGRESYGQFGSARTEDRSWVVRLSTNGKGNARQLSSPVRPELSRRVSGSGGRIVVVEHAGLRSCFDKLSTNGRESYGQFGSARTEDRVMGSSA